MFSKSKTKDLFLHDTPVENIFLSEFLPTAPGDFLKVYLYALMHAEYKVNLTDKQIAVHLNLSEKRISEAWTYWEELGVIRKSFINAAGTADYSIEFLSIREMMFGVAPSEPEETAPQMSEAIMLSKEQFKKFFADVEQRMGRSLSPTELQALVGWVNDEKITTEVIQYGIQYCIEKGKTSFNYISKVIHNWHEKGLSTVDEVDVYLDENDQRFFLYRNVLQELGLQRNATGQEKRLMDQWLDEYGFGIDRILEACKKTAGITNPNFNYVNKVLVNWKNEAKRRGSDDVNKPMNVTQAQLNEYYSYLRDRAEKEAEERVEQVYRTIPRMREVVQRISELGLTLSRRMLEEKDEAGEKESVMLHQELEKMHTEQSELLRNHGFAPDCMEKKFLCEKCRDTGLTDAGTTCSCRLARMEEAENWLKQREAR